MEAFKGYKGTLYLVPTFLGEHAPIDTLSIGTARIINESEVFFCENEKDGRRFLKKAGIERPLNELVLKQLDKDTDTKTLLEYSKIIQSGKTAALLSDAGCPAIADPGGAFIKLCHEKHIKVIPVPGPSSILLALMASGLNGQQFTFNGYLPIPKHERIKALQNLQTKAINHTQIFMETPYRNIGLFNDIQAALNESTLLCIAAGINTPSEFIFTTTIAHWQKINPPIHKIPALFLILKP